MLRARLGGRRAQFHAALRRVVVWFIGRPCHQPSKTMISPARDNTTPIAAGTNALLIASARADAELIFSPDRMVIISAAVTALPTSPQTMRIQPVRLKVFIFTF